jgi:hypothetical protein
MSWQDEPLGVLEFDYTNHHGNPHHYVVDFAAGHKPGFGRGGGPLTASGQTISRDGDKRPEMGPRRRTFEVAGMSNVKRIAPRPSPLTVYECPECASLDVSGTRCESLPDHDRRRAAVRVFREEDVRSLWEVVAAVAVHDEVKGWNTPAIRVRDAFPAPEEWKA